MAKFLQMAPMQAMTDIHFMNTYQTFFGGFTEMMAPYIMASGNSPMKVQKVQKHFLDLNSEIKLIPQLLSNDADGFLYFANTLYDLGYTKINWNLGCPNPFVMKKQRGAGLLAYPDKIEELLENIVPNLKPEFSVKIRLGLTHSDEVFPIIKILNKFPIGETIVHTRTAAQNYEGMANKEFFKEIYPLFNMPVIYNGDILTKEHVTELEDIFPNIKGFMIGRGAFINPFITNQINGIICTETEKLSKYKDFYFELHNYYKVKSQTEQGFLGKMKDLWFYFSQSFHKGESYLFALKTINDIHLFENTIHNIFASGKLKI